MTHREGLRIAKQAYGFFLRQGRKEHNIGNYSAQVCITDNHGSYVAVTASDGVRRYAVKKTWS